MTNELLMGNEAMALGAIRAGVQLVTGYPGTPSTEVLETIAKHNDGSLYVEWSINEKVALEVAAGAAYAGARTLVTMKQVGLNVASDPLMSLAYVGIKGGMVVLVADDPGPISSQTEQDTRYFAHFAKLPLFDPATPEEAYLMMADAFALSERYRRPVLFRPTTRVCHSCASVTLLAALPRRPIEGFVKDSKWVIFPRLAYLNHLDIEKNIPALRDDLAAYPYNRLNGKGNGGKGIAVGGVSATYVYEALKMFPDLESYKVLHVSTYPLPYTLARSFLEGLDEVLVVEELDPVIERELTYLCGLDRRPITVHGKLDGIMPQAGEYSVEGVMAAVRAFLAPSRKLAAALPAEPLSSTASSPPSVAALPLSPAPPEDTTAEGGTALPQDIALPPNIALPVRPPVLCAGCPHRASFLAVKEAVKGRRAVFSGDIGCYTLGNALPLDMVDTCLCMGAGIAIAQGLQRAEPDVLHMAFIGDSTFFHSGITGILNAVYNQTDIVVVILDNGTTAMTGNQPHPGTGRTMMDRSGGKIDIARLVQALGVNVCLQANPLDFEEAKRAVAAVADGSGVRVLLFQAPCIALSRSQTENVVDQDKCVGCKICIKKLGCPAITFAEGRARIDPGLCTGCNICSVLCKVGAIQNRARAGRGRGLTGKEMPSRDLPDSEMSDKDIPNRDLRVDNFSGKEGRRS